MKEIECYFKHLILSAFSASVIILLCDKVDVVPTTTDVILIVGICCGLFIVISNSLWIVGDSVSEAIKTLLGWYKTDD